MRFARGQKREKRKTSTRVSRGRLEIITLPRTTGAIYYSVVRDESTRRGNTTRRIINRRSIVVFSRSGLCMRARVFLHN